ncbi:MAG: TIGR01459 family HAD-type hydrolase [Qingshengfaniella sp.]
MTRIIRSLAEISASYDALFCDLWGCVHNGVRVFPEAIAALQAFRAGGGKVIMVTNSPRPRDSVARQLDGLGAPRDCWDDIATSGDAAQAGMMAGVVGRKVWHLGPDRDRYFFTDLPKGLPGAPVDLVPFDEAEGIVCTGLEDDSTETPDTYRARLIAAKARGLRLLCANPDIVVDRGDQRIFCAGAIAALYTEMGGQSLYFGKPHPPIYDVARQRLTGLGPIAEDRILAIGDGPGTDMAGALGEDLDFLFISGGLSGEVTGTGPDGPDAEKLAGHLADLRMSPTYTIGMLR